MPYIIVAMVVGIITLALTRLIKDRKKIGLILGFVFIVYIAVFAIIGLLR